MPAPTFRESSEALDCYSKKGGITGIASSVVDKFYSFRDELIKRANEIWLKAFPRGKPITDIRDITRRIGIFRARAKERPELRPLLEEYEKIAILVRRWRESESLVKELEKLYKEYYSRMLDLTDSAGDWEYLHSVIRRCNAIITTLNDRLGIFEEEYWLSQLFIQHLAINYFTYTGERERHINFIFQAFVHAEVLYLEKLKEAVKAPLMLTPKEYRITLIYGFLSPYEFILWIGEPTDFGIDYTGLKYDYGFKDYEAELMVEDLDTGNIKATRYTKLPWNWPTYSDSEILKYFRFREEDILKAIGKAEGLHLI